MSKGLSIPTNHNSCYTIQYVKSNLLSRFEELGTSFLLDPDDNFDPPELMDDDALDNCNNAPKNCHEFVTEETEVRK